ncbi:DNA methylase [Bacteroides thetaiotaomicron]|nr:MULTISPECIES: DNA methylase [Bacteroidales]MCS2203471.1 DNA methylase [Bacteroides thetaiotaomicron]
MELAPPTPKVAEKEKDGQEVKPDAEGVRGISPQQTDDVPQIRNSMDERSPSGNFIADHVIIGRPGFQFKDENRPKRMKI